MKKKKKSIMKTKDEFEIFKILQLSIKTIFDYERHHMQLELFMQLIGITNNWPSTLLDVCYSNIKITLLPNSQKNKFSKKLMKIVFKHTKKYLGEKKIFVFFFITFLSYRVI